MVGGEPSAQGGRMVNVLVSYDVSGQQGQVKTAMEALGYSDRGTDNNRTYYLPYTTLWKRDVPSLETGISDLQAVTARIGVTLERAVSVQAFPWAAIPGAPQLLTRPPSERSAGLFAPAI
jgi:hypothetical protein